MILRRWKRHQQHGRDLDGLHNEGQSREDANLQVGRAEGQSKGSQKAAGGDAFQTSGGSHLPDAHPHSPGGFLLGYDRSRRKCRQYVHV